MNDILTNAREFLYKHLQTSTVDQEEKNYRYEHTLRVTNIGIELAKREGGNAKIVALGCMLHDVGKFDSETEVDHGRVSAKVAEQFLRTQSLTEQEIKDICYAIAVHVDGKAGYDYEHTLEAGIVSDADNLDRFGAYRIHAIMSDDLKNVTSVDEQKTKLRERIERLQKYHEQGILETKTGNELMKSQLELWITYFTNYLTQVERTSIPVIE